MQCSAKFKINSNFISFLFGFLYILSKNLTKRPCISYNDQIIRCFQPHNMHIRYQYSKYTAIQNEAIIIFSFGTQSNGSLWGICFGILSYIYNVCLNLYVCIMHMLICTLKKYTLFFLVGFSLLTPYILLYIIIYLFVCYKCQKLY